MEEFFLEENEVLDDLQINGLKIVQNKKDYRFSSDSIMLSKFAQCSKSNFVVEFCSGSGVISILLNEQCHPKKIVGFEVQENLCKMANKTLMLNNIKNIHFLNVPLEQSSSYVGEGKVDVIICNPPYYKLNENDKINPKYKITKYETLTNLENIFKTANKILKYGGKFFMVHIPARLQEILVVASKYKFECKTLQFVYPTKIKPFSHLVLIMFTKGGKTGIDVLKPIVLN